MGNCCLLGYFVLLDFQMELKYIVVTDEKGEEKGIVFEKSLTHRSIASCHSASRGPRVISAGFCSITPDGVKAYGESESLGRLQSRPEDSEVLRKMFGL